MRNLILGLITLSYFTTFAQADTIRRGWRHEPDDIVAMIYPRIGFSAFTGGQYATELGIQVKKIAFYPTCTLPIFGYYGGYISTNVNFLNPYKFNLNSGFEFDFFSLGFGLHHQFQQYTQRNIHSLGPSISFWFLIGQLDYNYNFKLSGPNDLFYPKHRFTIHVDTWLLFKKMGLKWNAGGE